MPDGASVPAPTSDYSSSLLLRLRGFFRGAAARDAGDLLKSVNSPAAGR